jgi:hypothetical protein
MTNILYILVVLIIIKLFSKLRKGPIFFSSIKISNIMKKIILIFIILLLFIFLRGLVNASIPFLAITTNGSEELYRKLLYSHMIGTHYFYWLFFLPILSIRTILINFNIKEKLFNQKIMLNQEILFNMCYLILFIVIDWLSMIAYNNDLFYIPVFIGIWFALWHFKSIKIYIYNLYE